MDHVVGGITEPNFRLPGDGLHVFPELPEVRKGTDIDGSRRAGGQHFLQFDDPLRRHGTVRGDRLDQKQPVPSDVVEHHIGQLIVIGEGNVKSRKAGPVDEQVLPGRVSEVEQARAGSEAGRELLDHGLLYLVVTARREPKLPAAGQRDRNQVVFALALVAFREGASLAAESGRSCVPLVRSVAANGLQGGFRDGVMGTRAVRRKVWFEGIVVGDPALNELMGHLAAEGFPRVRRIVGPVVLLEIVHDALGDGA